MNCSPYTNCRSLSCITPDDKKYRGQYKQSLKDPQISLQRNRLSSMADLKKPYLNAEQSTTEKLKTFISHLRESDLLAWFQRYLQKTQAKFHHEFYIREKPTAYEKFKSKDEKNENYAACECYFESQKYGSYGPVISEATNASQSLIAAIKKLTLQYILMDKKCNRQILIECLKTRKSSQVKSPVALLPNNHVLKIKKSPRIDIPPDKAKIEINSKPYRDQSNIEECKVIAEIGLQEQKMKVQLLQIFEKISALQQKIRKEKEVHKQLLSQDKLVRIEEEASKKEDRKILGEVHQNAEAIRKQYKINLKDPENEYSNLYSKANILLRNQNKAQKSRPSNRLATVV